MAIFNVPPDTTPADVQWARSVTLLLNQIADELVRLYRLGRDAVWMQEGKTIADCQDMLDELGEECIPIFQKAAAFGQFIHENYPGMLDESELTSPVPYEIDNEGRLVLDSEAMYPGSASSL